MAHRILLTAGGGNIGSYLVPQLLNDNVKLVLPTSNATRMKSNLPEKATDDTVTVEQGNIKDPQWIEQIVKKNDVDTVFLCLTGPDELIVTLNFFDALKRAGTVRHLVYLSGAGDFVSDEGSQHAVSIHSAAHTVVKPIIERKLRDSNYPWSTTVVGPTLFFSNDLRSKNAMLNDGFFDEPLGEAGVSRVAPVDIAAVVRNALVDQHKWAGKKIMVGSKHRFTGTEITKMWSDAIGKPVHMCKADEGGFNTLEEQLGAKIPMGDLAKAWARDLRLMYETFAQHGFYFSDEDYEVLVECLGREPMSYPEFVAETGKSWVS